MTSRARSLPVLIVLAVLFLLPFAASGKVIPPLGSRVVDQANLLSADARQRLETKLAQFEQQTGDQVAVLTVDSLEDEAIEDYANKVARAWALGQKGKDNGVLLLVAKQDRKMRIEVGYGLEPVLTDLQTNLIQTQVIIPFFKKGDFGGGIEAGVDAILTTLQGKPFQPAPAAQPVERGKGGPDFGFLLFVLFILLPFSLNAARSRSWFLYLILMPVYFFLGFLFVNVTVGLIALGLWGVAFPILRAVLPQSMGRGGRGGPGGWFFPGGGGWGGGGGGGWSGGGGGGFSGGGGSFGGGGSSSSW